MKIAILAAMDSELDPIKNRFLCKSLQMHSATYFVSHYKSATLFFVKTGIGKVSASLSATQLIMKLQPDYIISMGSAGAVSKKIKMGDILVATDMCYHDVDLTAFNYKPGQLPQVPFPIPINSNFNPLIIQTLIDHHLDFHQGLIATGDVFVSSTQQLEAIKKNFPAVLALEMESAAIAQVCDFFKIKFDVIRIVSDHVSEDSKSEHVTSLEAVSERLTDFIVHLLEKLVSDAIK